MRDTAESDFEGASIGLARFRQAVRPEQATGGIGQFIDYSRLRCEASVSEGEAEALNPGIILSVFPVLLGLFAAQPATVQTVTRLVVEDEVILRIPVQPRSFAPGVEWLERKGPKCIPSGAIRAALLSGPEQVDFILDNRARVRARFDEDCPALDFYGGFYVQTDDERLCAGRDAVHSRMGGSCTIERFRLLVPKLR